MTVTLRQAEYSEAEKVVECLVEAFWDDPPTNYILGLDVDPDSKSKNLSNSFRPAVYEAFRRNAHIMAMADSDSPKEFLGCAVWFSPDAKPESFMYLAWYGGWRMLLLPREIQNRVLKEFLEQASVTKKKVMKEHNSQGGENGKYWYLQFIGTTKKGRGKGYGKTMIRYGTEMADKEGIPTYLESSTMDNAKYVYEPHGFQQVELITFKNGEIPLPCMIRQPKKIVNE